MELALLLWCKCPVPDINNLHPSIVFITRKFLMPYRYLMTKLGRSLMVLKCGLVEIVLAVFCFAEETTWNGGWEANELGEARSLLTRDAPCNMDTHQAGSLTQKEFLKRYAYSEPVIITDFDNSDFRQLCQRDRLLENYGDFQVQLSTANTYSYKKVTVTLREYLEDYLKPQKMDQLGNETYYLFGDIDRVAWDRLLRHYLRPPWTVPRHKGELSFGIAGAGTGVPFHFHGPGFGEVLFGKKRWFLYPPEYRPDFDPDKSTLDWFFHDYPKLNRDKKPLECILQPGQVIYFPDRWWHATLNIETSVFMSTFLSP